MKKITLGLLAILVSVTLFAAPRTAEEAAAIAAQFTNQQPQLLRMHKAPRTAATMRLAHKAQQNNSEEAAFYVFNQENNNGFVIVSADDRTVEDVLGYTDKGSFDIEKINPNLRWWLGRYAEEITVLQTMDDSEFIDEPAARKAAQVTAIAPLLKNSEGKEITWYQEAPYYNLCPMDQRDNTRCLTGCVATAASMVMYKWRHPAQGTGSSSYTWYNCLNDNCEYPGEYIENTLSANYGATTYDWNNMLPAYYGKNATSAQKTAVATLMYHAGVSCEMMYGGNATGGSGAMTDYMAYGLMTYFGYDLDKFITMYSQEVYGSAHDGVPAEFSVTRDLFITYFNADLEAGRPIIMGGEGNAGGHEFVCDGRDSNNRFHINFGWEGDGNGYYAITSLKPSGYNFSNNLDAIIGLRPRQIEPVDPVDITWSVDGQTSTTQATPGSTLVLPTSPANCSDTRVFVGWTAQSTITGGAKPADLFTTGTGKTVTAAATYYAVFADVTGEGGDSPEVTDRLTRQTTGITNNNYASWSGKTLNSSAVYAGQSAGGNESIQLRSNNSNSGIVTTASGGKITKVTVEWNSNTDNARTLDVYGKNSAYDTPSDLYDASAKGTKLGSIKKENGTELTINGDYTYVGVRSNSGALYLTSISFTWGGGGSVSYSNYGLSCGGGTAIENITVAPKAVKVIENGQIIIIRDNEKYTIFGQKIQ